MMTLVRICGQHKRAVERDLVTLGLDWEDVGTPKLSLWKLISIVLASPPGTAVYHAETRSGTMTPEQQMWARAMGSQVPERDSSSESDAVADHEDPLSTLASVTIGNQSVMLEALPPDELTRKREEIAAKIRASEGGLRDTVHTEKYDPFEAGKRARAERLRQMQPGPSLPLPAHIANEAEGPQLPAHIASEVKGPPLPAHIGGML